jgi:hypothetical protein
MTTLVVENLPTLAALIRNLRMPLARLGRNIDALVSAKAARAVPEWQMRIVRSEFNRQSALIRAALVARSNGTRK